MLITIIIPVYNAEKKLKKCLESVENQTYKEIEVILVNDGSTDNSGQICDEYVENDSRFKVIHKQNNGVSSARNDALKIAKGDYIGFLDSDDWIESNMFEVLYQRIIEYKADISICGYFKAKVDGTVIDAPAKTIINKVSSNEALNSLLQIKGFIWNKLFSADIIRKNKIFFDENIHFCEDLLFCCQAIMSSRNIVIDSTPLYHYIIHDNNITKMQYTTKKLTALNALTKIIEMLSKVENIEIDRYKNYFMHLNISLMMHGINEKKCSKKELSVLKENLLKYKISSLRDRSVKVSCIMGRIHVYALYFIWKWKKNHSNF